jgi:hypothetical protein
MEIFGPLNYRDQRAAFPGAWSLWSGGAEMEEPRLRGVFISTKSERMCFGIRHGTRQI